LPVPQSNYYCPTDKRPYLSNTPNNNPHFRSPFSHIHTLTISNLTPKSSKPANTAFSLAEAKKTTTDPALNLWN